VLRRTKPNILHVNNGGFPGSPSCNAAVVSARLARVPVIVYVVNNLATGYGSPLRWGDWPLDRLAAKWVTTFVTGSRAAAEALRCVLPVGDDRVRTLHNGIAVRTPDETPAQTRARLGLMGDDIVILVVARLEPRKGHTFLIEAFARLHPPAAARAVLVIEGDGPEEARLREQASRLGLGDRVRFVGSERKVFNTMAAADIVALPSVAHEDFPNVVIEAMALGRPVVASRIAGTPEQVLDGETGFLVPPGDAGALASAAERLLLDPALRVAMGRAGQARFAEAFTAESAAARYWALYREFAARARHQSRAR
jgi:glycosyltransferase involved in cell wall biosynthesis